jgi:hypothetical protein
MRIAVFVSVGVMLAVDRHPFPGNDPGGGQMARRKPKAATGWGQGPVRRGAVQVDRRAVPP